MAADGSPLVVGQGVSQCANDKGELAAGVAAIPGELGSPEAVLADHGYASETEVEQVPDSGVDVYVAAGVEGCQRTHDFRPQVEQPRREPQAAWLEEMRKKLETEVGRPRYRLRKQTVEPVFGVIKAVLGFRGFRFRGLEAVRGEWNLVALAYNCKRWHGLRLAWAVAEPMSATVCARRANSGPADVRSQFLSISNSST